MAVPESLKNLTEIETPILAHVLKKDGLITGRLNVRSVILDLNSKKLGAVPVYCPACRELFDIKTRDTNETPIHYDPYAAGHPNAIASYDREDCIHRAKCLDEYWLKRDKQFLPCLGCKRYIPRKELL